MSVKSEKLNGVLSSIYRKDGEHFCLVGSLSSMAGPLITKGGMLIFKVDAQPQRSVFLSFPGEDSNELFQKLLEELKELTEYDKSTSKDHPIILNDDDEGHSVQDKESLENPSNEIAISKPDNKSEKEPEATTDTELLSTKDIHPLAIQEPPQDSDIRQLIREECFVEVSEEQKQKIENTMIELVEICRHKEILSMYDNVDDLIESALDTKLLSINSKSQHPDKKEQKAKNIEEQSAERSNHAKNSMQNFRVIHKNSISLNSSQISSVHTVAPILSTKEPKHPLSMGYEHLSITPKIESDEVTETNAKNLLPIPSECEVISEDESECDILDKDDSSPAFTTFSNPLFDNNDDFDSSDNESLPDEDVPTEEFKVYSNLFFDEDEINSDKLEPHCFNGEFDFVESLLNRETFIDSSSIFDFLLKEFSEDLNVEIADTIIESLPSSSIPIQDNDSREEIDLATDTDELLPPPFENDDEEEIEASNNLSFLHPLSESPNTEPDEESMNDIYDNDPFMKEVDLFLATDHLIPPEPPDDEFEFDPKSRDVILAVMDNIDEPNKDESFDPGGEIIISTKDEDVDYFPFMFVIRIFLHISSFLRFLLYSSPLRAKTPSLTLVSPSRSGGISLG
nr:hypothetical protein [Tanacetum cinerariifolium]